MKFKENSVQLNNKLLNKLSSKFHLHPSVMKLLFARNITNEEDIIRFLEPTIDGLYNPYRLHDMDKVVDKIKYYLNSDKNIVIIGDYDTDGICASAILYKYFLKQGKKSFVFLPNRVLDGYGLTIETVDKVIDLYNPQFIITVDCGISCYKEVDYIKSKGIDIIVTDHHEIPDILPNCLIIDPKLEANNSYPFNNLCGAGVALKLVQALGGLKDALNYIAIASIATVADMVPLIDENRVIVYQGLKNFDETAPIGVKKLVKKLDIKNITSTDISFKLAPKLNTAGRLKDASIAYKLFIDEDEGSIRNNINLLLSLNDTRISLCNQMFEECEERMKSINVSNVGAIVLDSEHWEQGVVGIICARLVEKYHRPVCLLTKTGDNEYKGSIRSVPGVNIFEALNNCNDLLLRFGGHEQAGGLGITYENIARFRDKLSKTIIEKYGYEYFEDTKYYDLDCDIKDVNYDLIDEIDKLEPFGFGNQRPIFRININNLKFNKMKNYEQHLKYYSKDLDIIAFNSGHMFDQINTTCSKYALVEFEKDTYTKKQRVKGKVKAMSFGKILTPIPFEKQSASAIETFDNKKVETFDVKSVDIKQLFDTNMFGTIVLCYDYDTYKNLSNQNFDVNYDYNTLSSSNGRNTIILAPDKNIDFGNYNSIIFADNIGAYSYYKNCENLGKNVYLLSNEVNKKLFKNISTDRGDFGAYHKILCDGSNKNIVANNKYDYFCSLKKLNPQNRGMKYDMFCFVTNVLDELGIFHQVCDNNEYFVKKLSTNSKNPLQNSIIYSKILNLIKHR